MDPINPRQVLADLESLIGQREMIRHCAAYLRERNTLLSPDGAIYPISWTSLAPPPGPSPTESGEDEEMKEIHRRVQKGFGLKAKEPGAPKKSVAFRETVNFGPVARALVFSPLTHNTQE